MFVAKLSKELNTTEIRSALKEAAEYVHGLNQTDADKRDANWQTDVRSGTSFIQNYDQVLHGLEAAEPAPEVRGPRGAHELHEAREARSLGEFAELNEEYREWAKNKGEYRSFPHIELNPTGEVRTLLDSTGNDNAALFRPVGQPTLPPQNLRQQRLFVRDLLSVIPTTLSSVPYIRELNPLTNETGVTAVAEGGLKPEQVMEFVQYDAPIRKLAAWIPATMEILQDAPTLRGYIDARLTYMLKLREEAQVLNGPGTTVNLTGIRQTAGLQTQAAVANDLPAVIGKSIGKIENVDGDPDGVAMNPLDYWSAAVARHSTQFDNGFGTGAPGTVPALSWGLPVVRTRSMEAGKLITGSWRLGAAILDRMQTTIRTADQHDDWFIYNKVAILIEERIGLAVHRPDFFVEGSITFS